ncbi:30S ribosomal protein S16-2, chloroplastic/mitochondrial-like [Hibiscus syriacus]|uniref:30S ribosomal protein S16-2, chloroplastic/mitochondrial-like n=1 Tax=Hibiscus syriacus TaxID=106335 RepID=UPI001922759D|nr:30S ribosomal protein S16-2, chloroplastic/mitochondrial-like [Hibiscus syriacus]
MWSSKKQKTVSRSTTEAEYGSLVDVASDITWLNALLNDMGVEVQSTPIVWSDNSKKVADWLKVKYVLAEHHVADGKHLEVLGYYNPLPEQDGGKRMGLNFERVKYWLSVVAQPSEPVQRILFRAGLLPPPPMAAMGCKGGPRDLHPVDPMTGCVLNLEKPDVEDGDRIETASSST